MRIQLVFFEFVRFELRYQLRQPLFWISGFFFFLLSFLAVTTDAVVIGGSIGRVNRNAPFVVMQLLLVMSILGTFVTTAFVASTVLRDFDQRTHELFFSSPLRKRDYLLGRFAGAFIVSLAVYVFVVLGIALGGLMPWLEPERVGPFLLGPYVFSMAVLVAPNVLLMATVFFSLATWTRSLMATYAALVAMFFGYLLSGNLLTDMENEALASLLDPFGSAAFGIATKYWTVAERNAQVLALSGAVLWNRLLWLGVGLSFLALAYSRFSFTLASRGKSKSKGLEEPSVDAIEPLRLRPVTQRFGARTALIQFLHRTWMEVRGVFRSPAFPVLLGFGVLNMIGNSTAMEQMFGTSVYPVTHLMVTILMGSFLFVFVILVAYAAELVWREKSFRLSEVEDALPVPNWVFWGAKMSALVFVLLALLVVSTVTGVGIQAYHGYFHFELNVYLEGLFLILGIQLVLAGVLAIFLQVLAYNKYLGMLLMILFFISGPALTALDFDHNLYQYAGAPDAPYSDMNGYGHFATPVFWFYVYWSFFAVLLLTAIHLLWPRGSESNLRTRWKIARGRLTRSVKIVGSIAGASFIVTGCYIFYNTNVVNEYLPGDVQEAQQARFEKEYKRYESLAQPRITSVYAEVDIYPDRRAVDIRGRYSLRNKTQEAIDAIHVLVSRGVEIEELELDGASLKSEDAELGYRIYAVEPPVEPGADLEMRFALAVENEGFVNHGSNTKIVGNGTFFNNFDYFPHIGYTEDFELQDPNDRRKHGLPPVQRMPDIDDEAARYRNYITGESDWVDFETVVSTSPGQIALAPGYLQREWEEDGRRFFHYRMDAPILGFWSYLSADWAVRRDRWKDVAIEIYYHPTHPYNVDRMIDAVKKSLDYYTRAFGPYQHRQVRIVEFPRYARFAQSFPNTIPFSESIGFIAKLDEEDEEAIDYVFYVTAHEVAHQWWAHQVIGGFVQGATVMSETMSQYSALMVMEKEYGPEKMRRFLKYELDAYLRGRGGELIEELPLLRVENQPYIHYRKGSLVMYALKDYVGEEALNAALKRYVEAAKFQQPPYTYSREFLSFVEEAVPADSRELLADLFENITLYDNRAIGATFEGRPDGTYLVRLEIEARKYRADGTGNETEVPMADLVDVAVFGGAEEGAPPEGKLLYLEKLRIDDSSDVIEIVVDEEPTKAGVDPFNKLVDRNPEDNVTSVSSPPQASGAKEPFASPPV